MKILTQYSYLVDLCEFLSPEAIVLGPEELSIQVAQPTGNHEIPSSMSIQLRNAVSSPGIYSMLKNSNFDALVISDDSLEGVDLFSLSQELQILSGISVKIVNYSPRNLVTLHESLEELGKKIGAKGKGHEYSEKLRAQTMDWVSNFYDRTKNKKVTFLSSVDSLKLAGYWIPDMIRAVSAVPQNGESGEADRATTWDEIVTFRPDVIVVAPRGMTVENSSALFKTINTEPKLESVPAVLRGEVYFADGIEHFYNPGVGLIDSQGIIMSAVAAFESGYITPKDSFYSLRWLELHRHRIFGK